MCYGVDGSAGVSGVSGMHGQRKAAGTKCCVRRRRAIQGGLGAVRLAQLAREARDSRAAQMAERTVRIDELVADAVSSGGETDRFYWTLVYDMEMAPSTTGRAMLLEHQIVPVPPQDLASDEDLHDELWTVVEALAASGVFILNSDHLCDRDLYARLYYRILDEPTRCLPPESEASEFIDCLHPMDLDEHGMGQRLYDREQSGREVDESVRGPGIRGPFNPRSLADRDRWMPRPRA